MMNGRVVALVDYGARIALTGFVDQRGRNREGERVGEG